MAGGGLMQLVAYGAQGIYGSYRDHHTTMNYGRCTTRTIARSDLNISKYKAFRKHDKYKQKSCPICLASFKPNSKVAYKSCKHICHKGCYNRISGGCPVCRHC